MVEHHTQIMDNIVAIVVRFLLFSLFIRLSININNKFFQIRKGEKMLKENLFTVIKTKKFVIKTLILIVAIGIISTILDSINPIFANHISMAQMSSTVDSSMSIQIYEQVQDYIWIVYICVIALVYQSDVKRFIKLNKRGKNDD